jgi:hypothetical protein
VADRSQSFETVKEAEAGGPDKIVRRWMLELQAADEEEKKYRTRGLEVESRYRDEERTGGSRFNILWSNTQILLAAIFSGNPKPDVRRRYRDKDETGKIAAQIQERGLAYSVDAHDFNTVVEDCVRDYLVPGRGQARVRYIPVMGRGPLQRISVGQDEEVEEDVEILEDEGGLFFEQEGEEEVVHESVISEYVPWDDYRQSPAKRWPDVRWVAFRTFMVREDLVSQFGSTVGNAVNLVDAWPTDTSESTYIGGDADEGNQIFDKALVWEIWDKVSGKMIVVSPGHDTPLHDDAAPLSFRDFFPCPKPIISVKSNRTLVPVPEFTLYQDQADELDKLTARIDAITQAIRVVGIYPSSVKENLKEMLRGRENTLIPVEGYDTLVEKGGLQGLIDWLPIQEMANVLQILISQRAQLIQSIFEITGVSDVFRGATDPRETLGAQRLKSQFGTLRLRPRQIEVERFVRDLFRLMAEVISEEFQPETMLRMTGMDLARNPQEMMEVMDLLRNDGERGFRIDVETDSTVAPDDSQDKQDVVEYISAMSNLFAQVMPMVQVGFLKPEMLGGILSFAGRRFKVGRDLEDIFDAVSDEDEEQAGGQPQGPDPAQQAAQAQQQEAQQEAQMKAQAETQKMQLAQAEAEGNMQIEREKLVIEREKMQLAREKMEADETIKRLEIELKALDGASV